MVSILRYANWTVVIQFREFLAVIHDLRLPSLSVISSTSAPLLGAG